MKKLYTLIVALLLTVITFAQAPEKMSYQAVVRDASNAFVKDTQVGMQISILQGSASGTAVYVETQTPTTNTNGLVSLEIGTGTTTDDFTSINWSTGTYFIKTETDPTGVTTNYTITSISQLMSVPFALHTKQAANGLPAGGTDGQILAINGSGVPEWTNPSTGQTYYLDTDDDGYGDINSAVIANVAPNGYVSNNTDCDDGDPAINPEAIEIVGNNIDENCDGNYLRYVDVDGDGYGSASTTSSSNSTAGSGESNTNNDCDDNDPARNPGVTEVVANGIDDDCDGEVDEAEIGQLRAGGIVFWVDPTDNTKGKVCMLGADEKSLDWVQAMNTVYTNTDTGTGVYSNWYVPIKDELQLMYANLKRFGCSTNTPGGGDYDVCATEKGNFSSGLYWSSTKEEIDIKVDPNNLTNNVYVQSFTNGAQDFYDISQNNYNTLIDTVYVRAVRAF